MMIRNALSCLESVGFIRVLRLLWMGIATLLHLMGVGAGISSIIIST